MQKKNPLPLDSFKEKLFETILQPLREENLSKEYHYQLCNMTHFHQHFCTLENKYAQIYAQAVTLENQLSHWNKNNLYESLPNLNFPKTPQKFSAHYAD